MLSKCRSAPLREPAGYAPGMTKTTATRVALAAGILGVIGGLITIIGGRPQGWIAIVCGAGMVALVMVESRRSRP